MSSHFIETPTISASPADITAYDLLLPHPPTFPWLFSVYQLTLLEVDYNGTDTPTGVVLALVGSCREDESLSKDVESTKSLRMYSLSSIVSLAKWAASSQVTSCSPFYCCCLKHPRGNLTPPLPVHASITFARVDTRKPTPWHPQEGSSQASTQHNQGSQITDHGQSNPDSAGSIQE